MCAIIAFNGKMTLPLLRHLIRQGSFWGPHATGAFYYDRGTPTVFKRAVHPRMFLRNHNRRIDQISSSPKAIIHTRYSTSVDTARLSEFAHPFRHDDIIFCHNGRLKGWESFAPWARIDSQALGPQIKLRTPSDIEGTIGLCWWENDDLYVYRLNKPLNVATLVWKDGSIGSVVVTHRHMLETADDYGLNFFAHWNTITEGTAYRVDVNGVTPAWSDCQPPVRSVDLNTIDNRRVRHRYHGG
jgi:glutamine phosphoribosylpyrophosphate amidotransferase